MARESLMEPPHLADEVSDIQMHHFHSPSSEHGDEPKGDIATEKEDLEERVPHLTSLLGQNSPGEDLYGKRRVYWNVLATLLISFAGEASRGLVLPSLWPYVNSMQGSKAFYGQCVAVFSVARFVGSIGLGYLSDYVSVKLISLICLGVCIFGNLIYSLAVLTPSYGKWLIMLSRVILGVGTSVVLSVRTHIAIISPPALRTRFFSWNAAAAYAGVALTPGLGLLLSYANFDIGSLPINGNSAPGLLLVLAYLPALLVTHCIMDDVTGKDQIKFDPHDFSEVAAPVAETPQPAAAAATTSTAASLWSSLRFKIGMFVFVNFSARICIALVETTGTPLFLQITGREPTVDSIAAASKFFEVLGLAGLLVFPTLEFAEKYVPGAILLDLAFVLVAAGCFVQSPYGSAMPTFWMFALGNTLIWSLASPITQVLVVSGLVSILGGQPPGKYLAMISGGGSVARMVGPIFATVVSYQIVFPTIGALSLVTALALSLFYWKSLQHT